MHAAHLVDISHGWISGIEHHKSPHYTPRDTSANISLLVIHNISLPPKVFGGNYITDFFMGKLDKSADPYFEHIAEMQVSAHCLIQRDGHIVQYVSFEDKAWHAGVSCYQGKEKCNDYSIGIELEGADDIPYTEAQYETLVKVTRLLQKFYPDIDNHITGHCDIAPERKTDPGRSFNWSKYHQLLKAQ